MSESCRWCGAAAIGADDLGAHCSAHAPTATDVPRMLALLERVELIEVQGERAETAAFVQQRRLDRLDQRWRR